MRNNQSIYEGHSHLEKWKFCKKSIWSQVWADSSLLRSFKITQEIHEWWWMLITNRWELFWGKWRHQSKSDEAEVTCVDPKGDCACFVFLTTRTCDGVSQPSDPSHSTNIPPVSLKEISYFSPGKVYTYPRKCGWPISAYLWNHLEKINLKKKLKKNGGTLFLKTEAKNDQREWKEDYRENKTLYVKGDGVPERVCMRVCMYVFASTSASLYSLYIIGREQALSTIFAPSPPPGLVHRFHVPDDVSRFKWDLRFVLCGNRIMTRWRPANHDAINISGGTLRALARRLRSKWQLTCLVVVESPDAHFWLRWDLKQRGVAILKNTTLSRWRLESFSTMIPGRQMQKVFSWPWHRTLRSIQISTLEQGPLPKSQPPQSRTPPHASSRPVLCRNIRPITHQSCWNPKQTIAVIRECVISTWHTLLNCKQKKSKNYEKDHARLVWMY